MFLFSALSAESKKETNSLRSLRLSGDYKLSNYNTIPYLRIRVLRENGTSKLLLILDGKIPIMDRVTWLAKEAFKGYKDGDLDFQTGPDEP